MTAMLVGSDIRSARTRSAAHAASPRARVQTALQQADLQAVIYHSDHLELSEQFDGTTGFATSVRDLTWSYAAFLSAVRAKTARDVRG